MKYLNNKFFWLILFLSGLCLFLIHYTIVYNGYLEIENDFQSYIDNILGVIIDVTTLFIISYLVIWKNQKTALTITFLATLFWSFSNVIYLRFFPQYISLSAMGQSMVLLDSEMISCIKNGLQWKDLFYLLFFSLFIILIKYVKPIKNPIIKMLTLLIAVVIIDICSDIVYCSLKPERRYISFFSEKIGHRHFSTELHLSFPNTATFRRGCIRKLFYEFVLNSKGTIQLSEKQLVQISDEIKRSKNDINTEYHGIKKDNIIFILIESYMSFVSDLKVNGREITPFLNELKYDSTVYYNGKMKENVTIGESSDGQFIYMTGLLPLRSTITVSKARSVTLPALPKFLGKESRMIIPTGATVWEQDEMCTQYAFNQLYSKDNFGGMDCYLNDEQVFQLAMLKDINSKSPFFSVILTMSMHQPYNNIVDPKFPISDKLVSDELACYLNACHYTDLQIERYFQHLKRIGLYDSSLIVIVADHPVHNTDFGGVSKDIPLYLINLPQGIIAKLWKGECNQVDVYSTLLDLMGIESNWYGLGKSLLSLNYHNTIDDIVWDVSEWIIRSDYFSNHPVTIQNP